MTRPGLRNPLLAAILAGCGVPKGSTAPSDTLGSDSADTRDTSASDSASPCDTSLADADGDGSLSITAGGDDCDDCDASVNPPAHEVCDGVDNDCDGEIDEVTSRSDCGVGQLLSVTDADLALTGFDNGLEVGGASAGVGDVNGDGSPDLLLGAPRNWGSPEASSGGAYLVYGGSAILATSGTRSLSHAALVLGGEGAGSAVAGVGDVDGDGCDDVLVGAPQLSERGGSHAGGAYLLLGAPGEAAVPDLDLKLTGEAENDYAGSAVAGVGDLDGDGRPEVLVGTYGGDVAYLLLSGGALSGASGKLSLGSADLQLTGGAGSALAGFAVSGAGDVDGDGISDVVVGDPEERTGGVAAGAMWLLEGIGGASGVESSEDADLKLTGEEAGEYAGAALASAGDTDGDGYADLVVGAPGIGADDAYPGAVCLLLGGGALYHASGAEDLSVADLTLTGEVESGYAGISVAGLGDMDGDGAPDLGIGAANGWSGGANVGSAYVLFSDGALAGASGALNLGASDLKVGGNAWEDAADKVASAGDINGDGYGDLLIGAAGDDVGGTDAGAVYVLYGGGL